MMPLCITLHMESTREICLLDQSTLGIQMNLQKYRGNRGEKAKAHCIAGAFMRPVGPVLPMACPLWEQVLLALELLNIAEFSHSN